MSTLQDIPLSRIDGSASSLGDFAGNVLLVVNVASKCGLTPQYAGLERLHEAYHDRGFAVLGFPANEFAAQEPGSNEEIVDFCTTNYGVQFPMFEKIVVKGPDQHPLYRQLTAAAPAATTKPDGSLRKKLEEYGLLSGGPSDILWNFEKFVIGRDGKVLARFAPDFEPDDPAIVGTIEKALAARA